MKKYTPLPAAKLRATLPISSIPYESSVNIPKNSSRHAFQHRALEALELGLHIPSSGYNIYLAGVPDLGRSYMLRDYLTPIAKKKATPEDLVYVFNFEDPDSPRLLALSPGQGTKLKKSLQDSIFKIQKEVNLRIEKTSFTEKRSLLLDQFQAQREKLYQRMNKLAVLQGFTLSMDDIGGMTLSPVVEGKKLNEQEYESLASEQRALLKRKSDSLLQPITGLLRKLAKAEEAFLDNEQSLEREIMEETLGVVFDPTIQKLIVSCGCDELKEYFEYLRSDILESHSQFLAQDTSASQGKNSPPPAPFGEHLLPQELLNRYDVNVFVDNSKTSGAPIIFEDHPTSPNLIGVIEREAEMGALITDFSLIKAGAIHKANGGYLVLRADDILRHQSAWEALIRTLRSGVSRIEDTSDEDAPKAKGLRPQPVPLSIKVILVGTEDLHEALLMSDERFSKLFKIKAHLTDQMPRDRHGIRTYMVHIRRIIEDESLLPFNQEALAKVVDYGSLLIEDQNKLSLKYPMLREIIIESSACATIAGKQVVEASDIAKAMEARNFRMNLVEDEYLEEYDRRIIKVVTNGEAVGKTNGLAVSSFGDFEFGLPHQISCTVGAGSGGIIDLERDAQLGGPIHTKAMMILKTYLVGSFAHNKPLILTGSLGFEQNYFGIEGDSASGAELAALLSALSGVPIKLNYAFTGAVGQSGEIMAVGSVTRKIEGYFEVCKRHGLAGNQGVLFPKDNIAHLMLNDKVVEAVENKQFHIYPVGHIKEALELLTGMPAGSLRKNGTYTPGSLYALVDERLRELSKIATKHKK